MGVRQCKTTQPKLTYQQREKHLMTSLPPEPRCNFSENSRLATAGHHLSQQALCTLLGFHPNPTVFLKVTENHQSQVLVVGENLGHSLTGVSTLSQKSSIYFGC